MLEKFVKRLRRDARISYAQCGEDLIVDFALRELSIAKPSYLDLGAHHPSYLSNTYLFYERGCHGVCVEPDPTLHSYIERVRKRDVCLNVGVGVSDAVSANFYVMTTKTLNTFSKREAERYESYGTQKIETILQIPLLRVEQLIEKNFTKTPCFVSLDIEGLDFEIIKTFNFSRHRPEIFCIETITYTEDGTEEKVEELIEFMKARDYFVYADTYINTIFVDRAAWRQRAAAQKSAP